MITADGWLDWATRVPGPADKVYSDTNAGIGYVPHSADGFYSGWAERLFSTDREPDGSYTKFAAASVHGWIAYDGSVKQHYPITASCWASGSRFPNTHFIAFENEGGFEPHDEALTPAQIATNVRIMRELAQFRGWDSFRRPTSDADVSANLYEHNECVRWGSDATDCPSGRIPWAQLLQLLAQLAAGELPAPPAPPPAANLPASRSVIVHLETGQDAVMDIDEYARGVLPYEMATGWPLEALKAQAVAAKSYALAAGSVFTDTRSQVYGPLRYADTDAAVEAVRGVYLGFGGQVVMPFYFGNCNGHTRSPSQAGWAAASDRPYLVGVECSCGHDVYFGHGIGMCQRGAQAMAERGASFDEILRHYYTGIELLGFEAAVAPPPAGLSPANAQLYVVQPNDTLLTIAAKFGTDWPTLYMTNRAVLGDPNIVPAGMRLIVPRPPVDDADAGVYVVQSGDTLFALARTWNTSVDAIVAANNIADPTLIRVGQRLKRP